MEIKKLRRDEFYWEQIVSIPKLINGKWVDEDFIQAKYTFPNKYGASIICQPGSYGYEHGLLEMAWTITDGDDKTDFEIFQDVEGHLSAEQVHALLDKIKAMRGEE